MVKTRTHRAELTYVLADAGSYRQIFFVVICMAFVVFPDKYSNITKITTRTRPSTTFQAIVY